MNDSLFDSMKTAVQTVSFGCSFFFNSVLILLICTKSPKRIGSYKWLMVYFCVFAILFSALDFVLQPYILSIGPGFIVVTNIRNSFLGQVGETIFLSSLCGCFGVILATIAIHFVFRYFALERKGKLRYFQSEYLVGWLVIPLLVGIFWTLVTAYFCAPSAITMAYSRDRLQQNYGIDLDTMTYIGAVYFLKDLDGNKVIHTFHLVGMGILFSVMGLSISIVLFFGSKCYSRVKKLIYEGESSYTKNLQNQLYKALVAQALIPMIFIFMPVGLYLTLPLFGIEIEKTGELVTFIYAMYPALDPLPLIFIIDNYRFAILDCLGICQKHNRITAEPDEVTSVSRNVSHC